MKVLDLDAVRAFVLVADLASFTRAADALGTTQSAVSLKLKRLEAHLGKPLLARTPRVVKLAADGENFLPAARALLDAHERALGAISTGTVRLSLGVSEHVAVPDLPAVLTSLHRQDPGLSLEMHLGASTSLLPQYDERRFDAVIARHEPGEDPPIIAMFSSRVGMCKPASAAANCSPLVCWRMPMRRAASAGSRLR